MTQEKPVEEMSRLLEARLDEWRLREKNPRYCPKPVVTITREAGCGGESIAEMLATELGLHLYNWELVERIAQDDNVSAELVAKLEKDRPTQFQEFCDELEGVYDFPPERYFSSLKRVLLLIAIPGNAVIVGRGSNFFLPSNRKIGLCLVAPLTFRITNVMRELGLSKQNALRHISKLETEHRNLVKKYLRQDVQEPTEYHLIINTALVKPETIVQIVKAIIQDTKILN